MLLKPLFITSFLKAGTYINGHFSTLVNIFIRIGNNFFSYTIPSFFKIQPFFAWFFRCPNVFPASLRRNGRKNPHRDPRFPHTCRTVQPASEQTGGRPFGKSLPAFRADSAYFFFRRLRSFSVIWTNVWNCGCIIPQLSVSVKRKYEQYFISLK